MFYFTPLNLAWVHSLSTWWLALIFIICVCCLVAVLVVASIAAACYDTDVTRNEEHKDWDD
jgi:hypothetical protein